VQACASDDSDKQWYTPAIDGLVRLLRSINTSAHEQAAGALRSICVNSPANKLELNRVNGISALVNVLRTRLTCSVHHVSHYFFNFNHDTV